MLENFLSFFTDEPDVIFTLKKDFPRYNWISNTTKAQNSILENRYSMGIKPHHFNNSLIINIIPKF